MKRKKTRVGRGKRTEWGKQWEKKKSFAKSEKKKKVSPKGLFPPSIQNNIMCVNTNKYAVPDYNHDFAPNVNNKQNRLQSSPPEPAIPSLV